MHRTPVSLHHITWVVRDLAHTLASLSPVLPADAVVHESLPQRGVATARVRVGDTWLVFVQPLGPGAPADRLACAGEGPLLLSLGVASLDAAVDDAVARGARPAGPARTGVGGWKVVDLDRVLPGGTIVQLCEDPAAADDD
jgi:methylmalonyl-CoA/ethylmalonyl-CoA epimerase